MANLSMSCGSSDAEEEMEKEPTGKDSMFAALDSLMMVSLKPLSPKRQNILESDILHILDIVRRPAEPVVQPPPQVTPNVGLVSQIFSNPEIVLNICNSLGVRDVRNLRLTSRRLCAIASLWLRRHAVVRCSYVEDCHTSVEALLEMPQSWCPVVHEAANFRLHLKGYTLENSIIIQKFFKEHGPRIKWLEIKLSGGFESTKSTIVGATSCPKLQTLSLVGCTHQWYDAVPCFNLCLAKLEGRSVCSKLKDLRFYMKHPPHQGGSPSTRLKFGDNEYGFQLKRLSITNIDTVGLNKFVQRHANSLETLALLLPAAENLQLPSLPALKNLTVHKLTPLIGVSLDNRGELPALESFAVKKCTGLHKFMSQFPSSKGIKRISAKLKQGSRYDEDTDEFLLIWTWLLELENLHLCLRGVQGRLFPLSGYSNLTLLNLHCKIYFGSSEVDNLLSDYGVEACRRMRRWVRERAFPIRERVDIARLEIEAGVEMEPRSAIKNLKGLKTVSLSGRFSELAVLYCLHFLLKLESLSIRSERVRHSFLAHVSPWYSSVQIRKP